MPLFGRSYRAQEPVPVGTANGATPNRTGSIFSRRRSPDVTSARSTSPSSTNVGSRWFRRSSSPSNHGNDGTILAARQKLSDAEEAERTAERALQQARYAAHDAKEHVKIVEREAAQE
ncbi:hypothetical protein NEOLEDRAFT_1128770 [Neolentinus lepideus HHB14362 ss-1]|uniref:Uncharacterized protein n=1 Tax=Neolentinus lepideus HHB14362 ss-1 TaxID=1314782 RepID=A0A165V5A1_9AGAM|nr:hypothetical protein NEOLEDRAFT_1128770 [Neolentinus lepideus HHB14362 ss-1]